MSMEPEVTQIFQASSAVSSKFVPALRSYSDSNNLVCVSTASKGVSAHLCKVDSKRHRTKAEMHAFASREAVEKFFEQE